PPDDLDSLGGAEAWTQREEQRDEPGDMRRRERRARHVTVLRWSGRRVDGTPGLTRLTPWRCHGHALTAIVRVAGFTIAERDRSDRAHPPDRRLQICVG